MHRLAWMPREDWFAFDAEHGVAVVADGVTRDTGLHLPYSKSLFGKVFTAVKYERPSKAGEAARRCVAHAHGFMSVQVEQGTYNARVPWFSLEFANRMIGEYQHELGLNPGSVDYGRNNYAGCVAAAARRVPGEVHWSYLADCGIAVVSHRGDLVYKTPDAGPDVENTERWRHPELEGKVWDDPAARQFIRKTFVNKPEQPHSYGTLTGEYAAVSYLCGGTFPVEERDHVFLYTDGIAEALFHGEKESEKWIDGGVATLISAGEWHHMRALLAERVRSEGTLVRLSR